MVEELELVEAWGPITPHFLLSVLYSVSSLPVIPWKVWIALLLGADKEALSTKYWVSAGEILAKAFVAVPEGWSAVVIVLLPTSTAVIVVPEGW